MSPLIAAAASDGVPRELQMGAWALAGVLALGLVGWGAARRLSPTLVRPLALLPLVVVATLLAVLGLAYTDAAGQRLAARVVAPHVADVGGRPLLRVHVRDVVTDAPIAGARIKAGRDSGWRRFAPGPSAFTAADGWAELPLPTPPEPPADTVFISHGALDAAVAHLATVLRAPDAVEAREVALTLDRPRYRPGQVLHLRGLVVDGHRRPVAGAPVALTVMDGRGKPVVSRQLTASDHGIAHADVPLAARLNPGAFTVRLEHAGRAVERRVEVGEYALPRARISVRPARSWARPGEAVEGVVAVELLAGGALVGAPVSLEGRDAVDRPLGALQGVTDAAGQLTFSLPGVSGRTVAELEAVVDVPGSGAERARARLTPADGPPRPRLVLAAEEHPLVPGVPCTVHVLALAASGEPLAGEVVVEPGGHRLRTDTDGLARFSLTPAPEAASVAVRARLVGTDVEAVVHLPVETTAGAFQLRPRLHQLAGPELELEARSLVDGAVFVDVVDGAAVVAQGRVEVVGGVGRATVRLPATARGSLVAQGIRPVGEALIVVNRALLASYGTPLTVTLTAPPGAPGDTVPLEVLVRRGTEPEVAAVSLLGVDAAALVGFPEPPGRELALREVRPEWLRSPLIEARPGLLGCLLAPGGDAAALTRCETVHAAARVPLAGSRRESRRGEEGGCRGSHPAPASCWSSAPLEPSLTFTAQPVSRAWATRARAQWSMRSFARDCLEVMALATPLLLALGIGAAAARRREEDEAPRPPLVRAALLVMLSTLAVALLLAAHPAHARWLQVRALRAGLDEVPSEWLVPWWSAAGAVLTTVLAALAVAWRAPLGAEPRRAALLLPPALAQALVLVALDDHSVLTAGDDAGVLIQAASLAPFAALPAVLILRGTRGGRAWPWLAATAVPFLMVAGAVIAGHRAALHFEALAASLQTSGAAGRDASGAGADGKEGGGGGGGGHPGAGGWRAPAASLPGATRVRAHFPETLLWQPELITDATGRARLDLPLADTVTTWKLSAQAVTRAGGHGAATLDLDVRQPLTVELGAPSALVVGDELDLPVSLQAAPDLGGRAEVSVAVEPALGVEGPARGVIGLAAGAVGRATFRVRALAPGEGRVRLTASLGAHHDAVERTITVVPAARRVTTVASGRLAGRVSVPVRVPPGAEPGLRSVEVALVRDELGVLVEALDGVFEEPHGCFEQTSNTTYPAVLALQVLRGAGRTAPEVEARARRTLDEGLQRLLSFEAEGGGFSLFGRGPASLPLTAYGLLQLAELAEVWPVDAAVLERTRRWLLDAVEAERRADRGDERAHALAAWALARAGAPPEQLASLLERVAAPRGADRRDPHGLALRGSALQAAGRAEAAAGMAETLAGLRVPGARSWSATEGGLLGYGRAADEETTALAARLLLLTGRDRPGAEQALTWLLERRGSGGRWTTTRATVAALRALLARGVTPTPAGRRRLTARVDGGTPVEVVLDPDAGERGRWVPLPLSPGVGDAVVELSAPEPHELPFQLVTTHHEPWGATPREAPLTLAVDLPATVRMGERFEAVVRVAPRERPVELPLVRLGLPAGTAPSRAGLDALVATGLLADYGVGVGEVTLYLEQLGAPLTLRVPLTATHVGEVTVPASTAYAYYAPDTVAVAPPRRLRLHAGSAARTR